MTTNKISDDSTTPSPTCSPKLSYTTPGVVEYKAQQENTAAPDAAQPAPKDDLSCYRQTHFNNDQANASRNYCSNIVSTSKYTPLTLLPKNLYEQFHRVANIYFLIISILQLTTGLSPTSRFTTAGPLLLVLSVNLIKELYEDLNRRKSDDIINAKTVQVLSGGRTETVLWADVKVGSIVKVMNHEQFPADLLFLGSSETLGVCYVETANLDGETNLKLKQAREETLAANTEAVLSAFTGHVVYEQPNDRIYDFDGQLICSGSDKPLALGAINILLRGTMLRNTEWIHGLVLFTGEETKIVKNSKKVSAKRSDVEGIVNRAIFLIFALLALLCTICTINFAVWSEANVPSAWYMGYDDKQSGAETAAGWITFLILFNNLVPISLYITLEIVKVQQSRLVDNDVDMYHAETNTPATARTSNLHEDLGQISYIFSDKTGTLTCNQMEFRQCYINGVVYGADSSGTPAEAQYKVDDERPLEFSDTSLMHHLRDTSHLNSQAIATFLTNLAVCHTVIPEMVDGKVKYQASSPDECALVQAAATFGYRFATRKAAAITVAVFDVEKPFTVLCVNEFNSTRKRMSVVVRDSEGNLFVMCKGADNVMLDLLAAEQNSTKTILVQELSTFAKQGLRTLVLGQRRMSEEEYEEWRHEYDAATTAMRDREQRLADVAAKLETNFILVGATAIEDKLQDRVPETIASLLDGGLKIWVLTGDKQETAINIAYSCRLFHAETELVIISTEDLASDGGVTADPTHLIREQLTAACQKHEQAIIKQENQHNLSVVIDGAALARVFESGSATTPGSIAHMFLRLGTISNTVVACRVSPAQKADVVKLVKNGVHPQPLTLSIGDGANDVSMIQTAHIGVGISGNEGMQAVRASDYAIAQFRFLQRLLLVHGRWNYKRVSFVILYSFYKNITLVLTLFYFCFANGNSGSTLYESWVSAGWNVGWTFFPIVFLGILDQDIWSSTALTNPVVYRSGIAKQDFSTKRMGLFVGNAVLHATLVYVLAMGVVGDAGLGGHGGGEDLYYTGTFVYSMLVLVVNFKLALNVHSWMGLSHLFVWGSILVYFLFVLVYSLQPWFGQLYGTAAALFSTSQLWLTVMVIPLAVMLPDVCGVYARRMYFPTPANLLREQQRGFGLNKLSTISPT